METILLSELIKASEKAGVIDANTFIRRFVILHPEVDIVNDLKDVSYGG